MPILYLPQPASSCPSASISCCQPWIPAVTMALLRQPGAIPVSPPCMPFIKFLQPSPFARRALGQVRMGWRKWQAAHSPPKPSAGSWLLLITAGDLLTNPASAAGRPTGDGCSGHEGIQASWQCMATLRQHGKCLQTASSRGTQQSDTCACCNGAAFSTWVRPALPVHCQCLLHFADAWGGRGSLAWAFLGARDTLHTPSLSASCLVPAQAPPNHIDRLGTL